MKTVSQKKAVLEECPTSQEIQELIANLTAIRAIGDLLSGAADSVGQGRSEFHEETLATIGVHLEDISNKALVILRHDKPRSQEAA